MPQKKVPRTRASNQWTEAKFWGFIRSNLRLMSRKWPPIARKFQNNRRPYEGPRKQQKWEVQCEICWGWRKMGDCAVDHIEPAGSLRGWDDVVPFLQRLLCEEAGLRILCKDCHQSVTKSQRNK